LSQVNLRIKLEDNIKMNITEARYEDIK